MTDPNETASLVGEITGAYREHLAEEGARHPVTYDEASTGSIADQIDRYAELTDREMTARSIATLQARGEYDEEKARILPVGKYQPLSTAELLEVLALGERIGRYYRHPSQVDKAVRAGATWEQIAAATGTDEDAARAGYREWAHGQHKFDFISDDEYAEALELAAAEAGR